MTDSLRSPPPMPGDTATRVSDDGLRYHSKVTGSPFENRPAAFGMLSCFFCGAHRGPSLRKIQKVLGHNQAVCEPACASNPVVRRLSAAATKSAR
jgi:hypothetical protein